MCRLVIFALFCVALAAANNIPSRPRLDGRIVGGQVVSIEDYPFQVSLQRSNSHICGGSIISNKWVLTAAHCTYGGSASSFSVTVGSDAKVGGTRISVSRIIQHTKFNYNTVDYDYSLLELAQTLTFSSKIQPVDLIGQDIDTPDGDLCDVSGWGNTQNGAESNAKLRATTVPKTNQAYCDKAYNGITDRMICAGFPQGGKDACQGDSGGPLIDSKRVLVGVVSWGYGCAEPNYPGVYSRVAAVRDWIKQNSGV